MIYSSINSNATLIDSVAYLLAYGKTVKNTVCVCYSNAAIIRADTVYLSKINISSYRYIKNFHINITKGGVIYEHPVYNVLATHLHSRSVRIPDVKEKCVSPVSFCGHTSRQGMTKYKQWLYLGVVLQENPTLFTLHVTHSFRWADLECGNFWNNRHLYICEGSPEVGH